MFFKKIKRIVKLVFAILWGFFTLFRIGSFSKPQRDKLPPYMNLFFLKMMSAFDIKVTAVNDIPKEHALWVGNHISWLDIAVVGTHCPVFFLSKAEVKSWPIIGKLATSAGTLYIKRGSGDANSIKDQIAEFLRQKIALIFFPEATTTDGRKVKNIHGKLLQASLDSDVPVQPVVMCYVTADGQLDMSIPYIDDMTFGESMNNILTNSGCTAYIMALEKVDPKGHDKASMTALLQERLNVGLETLHKQVLQSKQCTMGNQYF